MTENIDKIDNMDTTIDLNEFKMSPRPIRPKEIGDSIGYSILNNLDLTPEIIEVNNYSIDFLIQFSNMIRFVYNFVQDSFFNITSTQYTVIFIALSIIVFLFIIIIPNNKPKNICILMYFGLGFVILLAIKFVLKFLMICLDQIKGLFIQFKNLFKRINEISQINSFKDSFYFTYNNGGLVLSIFIKFVLLIVALMIAGGICIGIQLLFHLSNSLFSAISGMSDDSTDMSQKVKGTFGSAFKESMERL